MKRARKKRWTAILLSLVLILSLMPVHVLAEKKEVTDDNCVTLSYEVTSTPQNGEYYTEGEQVDFVISITNHNEEPIYRYGCGLNDWIIYGAQPNLQPGESYSGIMYSSTILEGDVETKTKSFFVSGTYELDGKEYTIEDTVTVLTGLSNPTVTDLTAVRENGQLTVSFESNFAGSYAYALLNEGESAPTDWSGYSQTSFTAGSNSFTVSDPSEATRISVMLWDENGEPLPDAPVEADITVNIVLPTLEDGFADLTEITTLPYSTEVDLGGEGAVLYDLGDDYSTYGKLLKVEVADGQMLNMGFRGSGDTVVDTVIEIYREASPGRFFIMESFDNDNSNGNGESASYNPPVAGNYYLAFLGYDEDEIGLCDLEVSATSSGTGESDSGSSEPVEIFVGDITLSGSAGAPAYALTDSTGAVTVTGADEDDYNIKWDGETLTIAGATITQGSYSLHNEAAAAICCETDLAIELIGNNIVNGPDGGDANGTFVSLGICAYGDISVSGYGVLNATGGNVEATGNAYSYGIAPLDGNIIIESGTVTATSGEATGEYAVSCGIVASSLAITGGEIDVVSSLAVDEGENSASDSYGMRIYGDAVVENATVYARGGQANYSAGIHIDGFLTVESGSVVALGGRAVNHHDSEDAASAGIEADGVTINGGEVTASVGRSEHGSANGIYAYSDIHINGGSVTAANDPYAVDGVTPLYSNGIYSETGDITITGRNTVVNASAGCADEGVTAIMAEAGDIVINGGNVRADGASTGSEYLSFGNGLRALEGGDGTGGNIILSGGTLAATGYTDSIHYGGKLIARPASGEITVSVLDEWISGDGTWLPDWDKMAADATEINGSPFAEEAVIA